MPACSTSRTWASWRSAAPARSTSCSSALSNDLDQIGEGQAQYTLLLDERGTPIDDLIAYRFADDHVLLVVNASRVDDDRGMDRRGAAVRRRAGRPQRRARHAGAPGAGGARAGGAARPGAVRLHAGDRGRRSRHRCPHGLHRRAGGRADGRAGAAPASCGMRWSRRRHTCRAGRARHAAAGGLLSALRQRSRSRAHCARGRPGLGLRAGREGFRRRRRAARAAARPAATTGWSLSAPSTGACRGRACRSAPAAPSPAAPCRRHWVSVSAWATFPTAAAMPGTRLEIDVRGRTLAGRGRQEAAVRQGEDMSDANYPDGPALQRGARLGSGRGRYRHLRYHLVRAGHAGRGRVLQPHRRRRDRQQGRRVRRARVDQGRVGADRPAVG